MKNSGKIFEEDFKKSISSEVLYIRLPDPPQAFVKTKTTRFSAKNPCDCFLFDTQNQLLYALELKTTKQKSISFESVSVIDDIKIRMIHKHQIVGLMEFQKYENVNGGFIFNFRDEKNDKQTTYYQNISNFLKMTKKIQKYSFNEKDLMKYKAIEIIGEKKRTHYKWDVSNLLHSLSIKKGTKE